MPQRIKWYKTSVSIGTLRQLTKRSNIRGLLQTIGHLVLLMATGTTAALFYYHSRILPALTITMIHGIIWSFLLNGFHELSHSTVFSSKSLNLFFLKLFSFLSWNNYLFFQASHREHHAYTLHPPDDLEVLLPIKLTVGDFLLRAIINPVGLVETIVGVARVALGKVSGDVPTGLGSASRDWMDHLFSEEKVEERRQLIRWARITLLGHTAIVGVSIWTGLWFLPLLITAAPFYGSWLLYLMNNTQHFGLMDNVPDFRRNSRTIILGPVLRFLYWNMNYHVEHHMYAAVPCYNLPALHEAIRHDTPEPIKGLIGTWKQIRHIQRRQREDPGYQYDALSQEKV